MGTSTPTTLWSRKVFRRILARLKIERLPSVASALAFITLLALVPLLTVMLAILSMFPFFVEWRDEIQTLLYSNLAPATGDAVQTYLQEFAGQAGSLTGLGLAGLLVTALFLLYTIEDAFNQIWSVSKGRTLSQRLLLYWAMLTLGPILMVISIAVTTYLGSNILGHWVSMASEPHEVVLGALPVLLQVLGFFLMYLIVPSCPVRPRSALVGAVVALVLFELTKCGFVIFISYFDTYQIIYGAMWSIPVFLLWIYLSWLVILLAACISAEIDETTKSPGPLPRVAPVIKSPR